MTTKTATARDQLFFDLFVTALEGGIGYWSYCKRYRWMDDKGGEDLAGFTATIIEDEDDVEWIIDRRVVSKGYRRASAEWRDKINWSTEAPPLVVTDDTDWDFDAGDADVIVQLGLFGKVVYG